MMRTWLTVDARYDREIKVCPNIPTMPDEGRSEGNLTIYFYTKERLLRVVGRSGLAVDAKLEVQFDTAQQG